MRKALHIHMLIQLLGFGHPSDIFGSDLLPNIFRRLWYFIASICFRSTESFARYMQVDAAMTAVQKEPLLPLTKKQRGMIGEVRSMASEKAQLSARGLAELPSERPMYTPMSYSASEIHKDAGVCEHVWAAGCVKQVAASTRKTGNHVCRPDVCHKGTLGRKGFCRMMFWHWARWVDEKKEATAKRSHGLALHARWDGQGHPPTHDAPPLLGSPALEISHPFHFKMTPSMLLGPTCNHDLGVLLRLGKFQGTSRSDVALQKREPNAVGIDHSVKRVMLVSADSQGAIRTWDGADHVPASEPKGPASVKSIGIQQKEAISSMLSSMGDHEFYCATYATKDQPHIEGLLVTLADGLRAKERDIMLARENGEDVAPHEVCRRFLHNLMASTNRRMHKGFPEMLSYLLRKPMEYCSHRFVSLMIEARLRRAMGVVTAASRGDSLPSLDADKRIGIGVANKCEVTEVDYNFRPEALISFPLYFFMAACVAHPRLNEQSMDWHVIAHQETSSDGQVVLLRQRSYHPDPITSKIYPGEPLCGKDNRPLHRYAYYVKLLTTSPWRVPVLYGRMPRTPTETSTAYERGVYGLFLMMLFRPHRVVEDLSKFVYDNKQAPANEDEAWDMVYQEFERWRQGVDAQAAEARAFEIDDEARSRVQPHIETLLASEPEFNSPHWWSCMISDKLRNYDTGMSKHGTDMSSMPTDVDDLPKFHATADLHAKDVKQDNASFLAREDDMDNGFDVDMRHGGDVHDCVEEDVTRRLPRSEAPTTAVHCGVLPPGCGLSEFHLPPSKIHGRSAEARYWQGFVTQFHEALPAADCETACRAQESDWHISSEEAVSAMERQRNFFQSIDRSDYDPKCCTPSSIELTGPSAGASKNSKDDFSITECIWGNNSIKFIFAWIFNEFIYRAYDKT